MSIKSPLPHSRLASAPDVEGLRAFADGTDRSNPPFFAGRREEIREIERGLSSAIVQWRRGETGAWKGRTTLIQGAPGAGKTALLERLAEKLRGRFKDAGLRVCRLESTLLFDPGYWISELGFALAPKQWKKINKSISKSIRFNVRVPGVAGAGGSLSAQKAAAVGYTAWGELERCLREEESLRPVLLLIDEVQNVPGKKDEPSPGGALLSIIHQATGNLPIFPVYGGLAWSSTRLGELGLSRKSLDYVRVLEPLSKSECREAVAGFFAKFQVQGSGERKRRWANEIAVECQGWPQHLNSHLQSLANGMVRGGADAKGDLDALDRAGLSAEIAKSAEEKRIQYYDERLAHSSALKSRRHLAAVAAGCFSGDAESVELHVLARAVRKASDSARADPDSPLALPDGMTPAGFVNAMVRAGVLHEDNRGNLSIPIPSFRQYLTNQYADDPDARAEDAKPPRLSP